MTNRTQRRTPLDATALKTTLVIGSLLATYVGADLLARQDLVTVAASANEAQQPEPETIYIPNGASDTPLQLELSPIPDVVTADQIPGRSRAADHLGKEMTKVEGREKGISPSNYTGATKRV